MIPVDVHLAQVLDLVVPLPPVLMPLQDARGLVLAEEVLASRDLPPFDNSAMDGYAVRSQDLAVQGIPATLRVSGEIFAGDALAAPLAAGCAMRIMTGAQLPPGADSVVPVELTDDGSSEVRIEIGVEPGAHIRRAAEDLARGAVAVTMGSSVNSRNIALLASCDRSHVMVQPRPRVTVISTGDELVVAGQPVGPGQIVDSNGPMLAAAMSEAGAVVRQVGPIADTPEAVRAALIDASRTSDLIVTSGGVSMGTRDSMKEVLRELGGVEFVKVAMSPGMPQGCGTVNGTPIITLPGNPVSSFVSFEVFVRPALRRLLGQAEPQRPLRSATMDIAMSSPGSKRQYARGILRGGDVLTVTPVLGQGSHFIGDLALANCLIIIDEGVDAVAAGATVKVLDLR